MNLINFIVWLSTGAVIGWFASRMVKTERKLTDKPITVTVKDSGSGKS